MNAGLAFGGLEPERSWLFGLCYRMTGSAPDADDLVQETFVRAMERPPKDTGAPWRPWLVRVAVNLAKDQLRRRRRRAYRGTWLPSPLDAPLLDVESPEPSPEARYGAAESASFAFLVALEALTPSQRAVLVLRDAFDFSSRETADVLHLSEENVRVTLHRARRAMESYDRARTPVGAGARAAAEEMLRRLLGHVASGDLEGATALFAENARLVTDSGGAYPAAPMPVVGPRKIVKIYTKLASKTSPGARIQIRTVNGAAALVGEDPSPSRPAAPRFVLLLDLGSDGRIRTLYSIIAPEKLRGIAGWGEARGGVVASPS